MDTSDVTRFVAATSIGGLPPAVVAMGKLKILDTVGTMFAGIDTNAARIARRFVEAKAGEGQATVFGSNRRRVPGCTGRVSG